MKLVALVFLVACGSKSEPPAKSPCEVAVERGIGMTLEKRVAKTPDAKNLADELRPKLVATMTRLCVDDKWSETVVQCFQTAADIATCKNDLTPEQRGKYTQEMMKVMMPQGGPPPGGMPGSGHSR